MDSEKITPPHKLFLIYLKKLWMPLDKGEYACGIFIDLQKAFDTVDHEILSEKLFHYVHVGKLCLYLSPNLLVLTHMTHQPWCPPRFSIRSATFSFIYKRFTLCYKVLLSSSLC